MLYPCLSMRCTRIRTCMPLVHLCGPAQCESVGEVAYRVRHGELPSPARDSLSGDEAVGLPWRASTRGRVCDGEWKVHRYAGLQAGARVRVGRAYPPDLHRVSTFAAQPWVGCPHDVEAALSSVSLRWRA